MVEGDRLFVAPGNSNIHKFCIANLHVIVMLFLFQEGNGIYWYEPHSRPVSAIVFNQEEGFDRFYSSSYDGCLRVCNLEKEVFDQQVVLEHGMTACDVRGHSLLIGLDDGSLLPVDCRQQT